MEQESIKEVIKRIVSTPVFKIQRERVENSRADERWNDQWFGKANAAKKEAEAACQKGDVCQIIS